MQNQSLLEFRAKLNASPALHEEAMRAFAADGEGLVSLGKKHGYAFTKEEALELLAKGGELSDFELELVAGGNTIDCGNYGGTKP